MSVGYSQDLTNISMSIHIMSVGCSCLLRHTAENLSAENLLDAGREKTNGRPKTRTEAGQG